MPFRSEAQRKFMFMEHPQIARRWAKEYGSKPIKKKIKERQVIDEALNRSYKKNGSSSPSR